MKKVYFVLLLALLSTAWTNTQDSTSSILVEEYDITLRLRVPRIYNNSQSLGQRKYQSQILKGTLQAIYYDDSLEPELNFSALSNRTHKVNGSCVTYEVSTDTPIWTLIGDNAKNRFKTASVAFHVDADPSYNIGPDEPDNTLILTLAGYGSYKRFSGTAAGQIGCGCREYGHISPTRIMKPAGSPGKVTDIAAVYGYWNAKLVRYYSFSLPLEQEDP